LTLLAVVLDLQLPCQLKPVSPACLAGSGVLGRKQKLTKWLENNKIRTTKIDPENKLKIFFQGHLTNVGFGFILTSPFGNR